MIDDYRAALGSIGAFGINRVGAGYTGVPLVLGSSNPGYTHYTANDQLLIQALLVGMASNGNDPVKVAVDDAPADAVVQA